MADHNGARATDWGRLRRSDLCVLSAGSLARCASEHLARGHPPGARFRDFEIRPCLNFVKKWLTRPKQSRFSQSLQAFASEALHFEPRIMQREQATRRGRTPSG
jgi:hypothetical protein